LVVQKLRPIPTRRERLFLYLFRASDGGIRLCKSRAASLLHQIQHPPEAGSPRYSLHVANIRDERYDTILIKTLPLAFRHAIPSPIVSLTGEKSNQERTRVTECIREMAGGRVRTRVRVCASSSRAHAHTGTHLFLFIRSERSEMERWPSFDLSQFH
jgi:hypothetical protein